MTHATLTCLDSGLQCVRWSGDTVLLWGSEDALGVQGDTRRLTRHMVGWGLWLFHVRVCQRDTCVATCRQCPGVATAKPRVYRCTLD